jgi:four helix bundle protein
VDINPKSEALNPKQASMIQAQNPRQKYYDFEDRTLIFARRVNQYVKSLFKNTPNIEIGRQLVRSAGSVGANYIEANESLSKKDFALRIRICRKEAKESRYWLDLSESNSEERLVLIKESIELTKIFGAIVEKIK